MQRDIPSLVHAGVVDLTVCGLVTIRVAPDDEAGAAVARHLGLRPATGGGSPEADLVVEVGRAREVVPPDGQGAPWRLHVRDPTDELLLPVIGRVALGRGVLPLHAAAWEQRGRGVAAAGWSGSGKTAVLLAFTGRGASLVAPEWSLLDADGVLHGIPQAVRLKPWHLDRAGPHLAPADRRRLLALDRGARVVHAASRLAPPLDRLAAGVDRRRFVDVDPHELAPVVPTAPLSALLLLHAVERPGVEVEALPHDEAVERLAQTLEDDDQPLGAALRRRRYHGDIAPPASCDAERRALLHDRLAGVHAFLVRHRHPGPEEPLVRALAEVLP